MVSKQEQVIFELRYSHYLTVIYKYFRFSTFNASSNKLHELDDLTRSRYKVILEFVIEHRLEFIHHLVSSKVEGRVCVRKVSKVKFDSFSFFFKYFSDSSQIYQIRSILFTLNICLKVIER